MTRLTQLAEYLFTHPGSTLALDSGTPGYYGDAGGARRPIFKQPLRSGQILLLFSDTIPFSHKKDFLAGKQISFVLETPRGSLSVKMEMKHEELRVRVALTEPGEELIGAKSEPITPAAMRPSPLMSLIERLTEKRASHLHLAEDRPAFVRVDGRLHCLEDFGPFGAEELRLVLASLAPPAMADAIGQQRSFEFSHLSKDAVLHVRGQFGREGLSVVIRAVPRQVPTPASLGVPDEFTQVLRGGGLWVVAGGAGQGTSSTVAALVQSALDKRAIDVCTLENPIDYVFEPRKGLVQQLQIGLHAPTFAAALEEARRGDADLVVVSHLDDAETLAGALSLADRGRLVLGVVHARGAVAAVQKLSELTAPGSTSLASQLRGVFAQGLVRNRSGGRSLCWELLPGTDAVRALIRERALGDLGALLSRTADQSLLQLVVRNEIEVEVALGHARDRAWLEEQLQRQIHPRAA
jgi:twitching motility protein PilT